MPCRILPSCVGGVGGIIFRAQSHASGLSPYVRLTGDSFHDSGGPSLDNCWSLQRRCACINCTDHNYASARSVSVSMASFIFRKV